MHLDFKHKRLAKKGGLIKLDINDSLNMLAVQVFEDLYNLWPPTVIPRLATEKASYFKE